jgi:hypothetical protein
MVAMDCVTFKRMKCVLTVVVFCKKSMHVMSRASCCKHGGRAPLGTPRHLLGRQGWMFDSHAAVQLKYRTGAGYFHVSATEIISPSKHIFPITQIPDASFLLTYMTKIIVFYKLKNKPHGRCTRLCVYSHAVSKDVNRLALLRTHDAGLWHFIKIILEKMQEDLSNPL